VLDEEHSSESEDDEKPERGDARYQQATSSHPGLHEDDDSDECEPASPNIRGGSARVTSRIRLAAISRGRAPPFFLKSAGTFMAAGIRARTQDLTGSTDRGRHRRARRGRISARQDT